MRRQPLTSVQRAVLTFIEDSIKSKGVPPTRAEITEAFGWSSVNSAQSHIRLIARKGYLKLHRGSVARGIQVI